MPFDPEAYPSIPEEEIVVSPRKGKTATSPVQQQAEQAVIEYQQRVAAVMAEQQAQAAVMTEARTRFAKASLYEQILGGNVFEGNDHITAEVNAEFRDFAQQKLCALLGIESESDKKKTKLTDEQIEVLAMMANSLLSRANGLSTKPQLPAGPPKVGKLTTVRRQPAQAQRPLPPPPPPQRATYTLPATPAPVQAPVQAEQLPLPLVATESVNVGERTRPDGTTFKVNQGLSQVVPPKTTRSPKPKPMPEPDMQVALAAAEGERNAGSSSIVQKVISVSSAGGQ